MQLFLFGKIGFPKIRGREEYNSHVEDKLQWRKLQKRVDYFTVS